MTACPAINRDASIMEEHGFQTVTGTDHRAWLWVVSLLSLVYSVLCLGARITGKYELLSYDDAILAGGYVFAIAHYGTLFKAIYNGLGVSRLILNASKISIIAEYYFASRIPYFIALCLSKVSILVFTRRIFSGDIYREKIFFAVAYAITGLYGICGILLSSAGCRPDEAIALGVDAVCDANVARWSMITALDVVTEFIILALPAWFISKNQIKASKKRIVVFVFSFRLIVAAFSIATTVTYFEYLNGSDLNIGISATIVWQEVLLCMSLVSASIPCLRSFLWAFMSTGLMTVYGNGNATSGASYANGSQPAPSHVRSQNRDDQQIFQSRLRPDQQGYKVDVRSQQPIDKRSKAARPSAENSIESFGSEQHIIHQTTEVEIARS